MTRLIIGTLKKQTTIIKHGLIMEALTQNIYNMYIPFLFVIGLVLQTPVYGSTLIKDRQDDLRYFLKFSGASSAPYLIGILLADSFLLMISFSFLLLIGHLIGVKTITESGGFLFALFACF
jgi:hypothetical protein